MKKAGGSSVGLLEYEKTHNAFLRALGDASLRKFAASLVPEQHVRGLSARSVSAWAQCAGG